MPTLPLVLINILDAPPTPKCNSCEFLELTIPALAGAPLTIPFAVAPCAPTSKIPPPAF